MMPDRGSLRETARAPGGRVAAARDGLTGRSVQAAGMCTFGARIAGLQLAWVQTAGLQAAGLWAAGLWAAGLRAAGAVALAALTLAAPAAAQDARLADIRAELTQLGADLQALRAEVMSSGSAGIQAAGGASALDRMNAMEAALSRLTAETEALGNRVGRAVADGTNRLGDLEFRLCELEPGCDIGAIAAAPPLGGGVAGGGAPGGPAAPMGNLSGGLSGASPAPGAGGTSLAVNEQADFDRAQEVLGQGDFRGAATLFAAFAETYPGGPLTGEALYLRGTALSEAGEETAAARAFLDAYEADPEGPLAADSLLRLGMSLGELGQPAEACATLGEVLALFPETAARDEADLARERQGCR